VYFEMGRIELLRSSGLDYKSLEERGFLLVVARIGVKFRAPARYDDLLTLETRIDRVTSVRVEHAYRLMRKGVLLAEGDSTLACVDREGRLQSLPPELAPPAG
jgi:acyl-CoA thioester hydrolase